MKEGWAREERRQRVLERLQRQECIGVCSSAGERPNLTSDSQIRVRVRVRREVFIKWTIRGSKSLGLGLELFI